MKTTTKKPLAKKRKGGPCLLGETGPGAGLNSRAGKKASKMGKVNMLNFKKPKLKRSSY